MKKEKKSLVLGVTYFSHKENRVRFQIIQQTHREKYFGEETGYPTPDVASNVFVARNGVELRSAAGPQVSRGGSFFLRLFVRGFEKRYDDEILECTIPEFDKFLKAVDEYNEFYESGIINPNCIPDELFVME